MKHKFPNSKDIKMLMIPSLVLITFFVLLFNVSTLKLGTGLGREVHLLTSDISNDEDFILFQKELKRDKIEVSISNSNTDRLLMKFVGVDDVEAFTKDLFIRFPKLFIYETGTFNSISNVTKMTKTIQSYFVVFLLAFVTVWTYRYRLWGLFFGLSISVMSLLVLFISNKLGYIFDYKLWFTTLVLFVILVLLKGWTIFKTTHDFDISTIIHYHAITALMLSLAAVSLYLLEPVFLDNALAVGIVVVLLVFETLYLNKALYYAKEEIEHDEKVAAYFSQRDSIKVPDIVDTKIVVISLTLLMLVVSLLSLSDPSRKEKHNPDFSMEHYLIVDNNDAVSFLEVQATLGKLDLSKHLLEYKISEEKKTWYVFDEFSNWYGLTQTKTAVEDKLGVDVNVIRKESFEYNFPMKFHLTFFISFTLINFLVLYLISNKSHPCHFVIINFAMLVFLHLFKFIFNINASLEFTLMQIFVPVFVLLSLLFFKEERDFFKTRGMGTILGYGASLLAMLVLPIVLIIPDPTSDHFYMISLFLIFSLAFMATLFVLFYINNSKEGEL